MHIDLIQARENLRVKLMQNAELVLQQVLNMNIDGLVEAGLFGSLSNNKFTCNSDADIYLVFEDKIPDRQTKGLIRSIAEENNCDIVFLTLNDFMKDEPDLLIKNILKNRIILWRRDVSDKK